MAQQHFDRLSAIDASFLHQEGANSHMHIGGLTILEGPPPDFEALLDSLRGRLHLVPRYRQKLVFPRLDTARPLWIDDPNFSLEYHVRRAALPAPGSEEQLRNLLGRVMSQQLDRDKPLWEMMVVEGLQDDRFALISKTHHSLIDGISGIDLATALFDLERVPREVEHPDEAWAPHTEPADGEVLASGLFGAVRTGLRIASRAATVATSPQATIRQARTAAEGVGEILWAGLNPAPPTPLNVPIGPHRRFAVVRSELADFKLVKNTFGGTVNDVVLATVTGALRAWLRSRGARTDGVEMRALVPVSIRTTDEKDTLGNRIAAMRGPLPIYIEDPLARLHTVRASMKDLKASKQAVGAEVLAGVQNFAPPTILAQASRLNFSTRLFNLIVTNVPGPQFPLFVQGREMLDAFPVAFLPENHALAIAIMSYNGKLNFGLLGDYDALPDIQSIADGIHAQIDELVALAKRAQPDARAAPVTTGRGRVGAPR